MKTKKLDSTIIKRWTLKRDLPRRKQTKTQHQKVCKQWNFYCAADATIRNCQVPNFFFGRLQDDSNDGMIIMQRSSAQQACCAWTIICARIQCPNDQRRNNKQMSVAIIVLDTKPLQSHCAADTKVAHHTGAPHAEAIRSFEVVFVLVFLSICNADANWQAGMPFVKETK